ncbi:MAG: hypothetical protein P1P87_09345 [Trueperaceae bacterium]|nr:hypothetical protein [Trueperaceae bacterium]
MHPFRAPTPPPAAAPRRPATGGRATRRARTLGLVATLIAATLALAACQGDATAAAPDAWTEAQIAGVFDLSELGRTLAVAPDGDHLTLDGRVLPPAVLERFPHLSMGRTLNLLRLGDDALAAMAPDAADFLVRAAPGELRERLAGYGLALVDVRTAWGDAGVLDLAGLRATAARLDASGGLQTAGVAPGTRLLADLGIAR